MNRSVPQHWKPTDILLSSAVFLALLFGAYGLLIVAPYGGFYFNPSTGEVLVIYEDNPPADLRPGDMIQRIGPVTWEAFKQDRTLSFFEGAQLGDVYEIVVQRDGREITLQWPYPGFNEPEFLGRFFNTWWLSFLFWAFGFFTHRYIRPRDLSWGLLVAVSYLLAMFISFGNLSTFRVLGASILMHAIAWMLAPVFLELHWFFPAPLWKIPRWSRHVLYTVFGSISVAELFQLLPGSLYFLSLLTAFFGSLTLLAFHYIRRPDHRSDIRLLTGVLLVSLMPMAIVSLSALSGELPVAAPLAFFTLTLLPASYIYAINRRRLGNLEMRASRAISTLAYIALLASLLPFAVSIIQQSVTKDLDNAFSFLLALAVAILTVFLYPRLKKFLEQRLLGITLSYRNILETYSTSISSSTNLPDLVSLLRDDIFNSLQVQQYAFVLKADGTDRLLLAKNVSMDQVQVEAALGMLAPGHDFRLVPPSGGSAPLDWIRLILPLKVDSAIVGVWLLGRRDPDDLYPQADLPIIRALASQTAIALSNIQQSERIKSMYQANVDRYEQERRRLARDLHDSVLNELAAMQMVIDPSAQTPEFRKAYGSVTQRLREIVSELRPPMLNFGLKPGLEELADKLMELNHDAIQIDVVLAGDEEVHYSQSVEQNIYRMVQEACENAIRHGQAKHVRIAGRLAPDSIELDIEDDGKGFDMGQPMQLEQLVADKHFGLAGIMERAMLIGAEADIRSAPRQGARVSIRWRPAA